MRNGRAFLAGLAFGLGLVVSRMTSPARVTGFLDITGTWDPTLAFVMGAALLVAAPLFALAARRGRALDGGILPSLPATLIDRRLVGGGALFGLGWGLAGLCPGPALVDLGIAPARALAFVVPMLVGLLVARKD